MRNDLYYDYPSVTQTKVNFRFSIALDFFIIIVLYIVKYIMHAVVQYPVRKMYFRLNDPELQFPIVKSTIPDWMTSVLNYVVPLSIITTTSLLWFGREHRKTHFLYSLKGWLLSTAIGVYFTGLCWVLLGGFRPNFIAVCNPDSVRIQSQVYYDHTICSSELPASVFRGFASGHASNAFSSWGFLIAYLVHHIRPFDNTGHVWKLFLSVIAPLTIPLWISISRIADYQHTTKQVIAGVVIGVFAAFISYMHNYIHTIYQSGTLLPIRNYWKQVT